MAGLKWIKALRRRGLSEELKANLAGPINIPFRELRFYPICIPSYLLRLSFASSYVLAVHESPFDERPASRTIIYFSRSHLIGRLG